MATEIFSYVGVLPSWLQYPTYLLLCLIAPPVFAQVDGIDFFELSLKDLSELKVRTATLSPSLLADTPSSITIITREQIEHTPARNILDLLETYVPGLSVFESNSGGDIRIRGMGQRNYKTVLLINGRPVNQKAQHGSIVELNNWDMTDIERIEIVRGPGSVTYGPGAISGVINIITTRAGTISGLRTGVDYNHQYQSKGIYLDYGGASNQVEYLFHASMRGTKGSPNPGIYQFKSNGEMGYKGDASSFSGTDGNPLANYRQDYDENPQVKLSVDVHFLQRWNFWARYTRAGHVNTDTMREFPDGFDSWRQYQDEHFISTLEHKATIAGNIEVSTVLSFDSEEFVQTKSTQSDLSSTSTLNRDLNFAENEWFFRSIAHLNYSENSSFSAGIEYSYDYLGSPRGEPGSTFRIGTSKQEFISEDSEYRGDGKNGTVKDENVVKFTDGWSSDTVSLMAELKHDFKNSITAFASGRVDKNRFTDVMFSPRLAVQSKLNEKNMLKLSWQRSLRMNTMPELYAEHINGIDTEPEISTAYELAYIYNYNQQLHSTVTTYQSASEVIAWSGDRAELVGKHEIRGLEWELMYETGEFSFGINHSYLHLLDWDFDLKEADGSASQKISLSDFLVIDDYLTLSSTGNALNFWSNNQTKIWGDIPMGENFFLHLNSRISWGDEYGDALFRIYEKGYAAVDVSSLTASEEVEYNENRIRLSEYKDVVDNKNAYGINVRFNASLTWNVPSFNDLRIIVYGQNLFNLTGNKRHRSQGYRKLPVTSWVEEPWSLSLKVESKF